MLAVFAIYANGRVAEGTAVLARQWLETDDGKELLADLRRRSRSRFIRAMRLALDGDGV
jgi:hypothetical protein